MANFEVKVSYSATLEGEFLLIEDLSNYSSNSEGYVYADFISRKLELRYQDTDIVTIINLPNPDGTNNSFQYPILEDEFIEATFKVTVVTVDGDMLLSYFKKIAYDAIAQYKLFKLVEKNLQNKCKSTKDLWNEADMVIEHARVAAEFGDGLQFNKDITTANKLLDICSCGH